MECTQVPPHGVATVHRTTHKAPNATVRFNHGHYAPMQSEGDGYGRTILFSACEQRIAHDFAHDLAARLYHNQRSYRRAVHTTILHARRRPSCA